MGAKKFPKMYGKPDYPAGREDVVEEDVPVPTTQQTEEEPPAKMAPGTLGDGSMPEYDYVKKVPKLIKIKKGGLFDAIYGIEDNIARSAGIMITGKESCRNKKKKKNLQLGEKSYFESGTCGPNSTPECVGKPRNIIVDNLPMRGNNGGLIPNIISDFGAFEPVEIVRSIAGTGNIVNERCSLQDVELVQLNPGADPLKKTRKLCVPDRRLNDVTPANPANPDNPEESFLNPGDEETLDQVAQKTLKAMQLGLLIAGCAVVAFISKA